MIRPERFLQSFALRIGWRRVGKHGGLPQARKSLAAVIHVGFPRLNVSMVNSAATSRHSKRGFPSSPSPTTPLPCSKSCPNHNKV